MIRAALLLLVLLGILAGAEAQTPTSGEGSPIVPTATEADYARVVGQAVTGYIVPAYGFLDATTGALVASVESFCAAPDAARANALRAAFDSTIHAWADVDFLRFGPMAQAGRYERFAFFPDVHGTGARQLRRFIASKDEKLLRPGALAGQSAAVQGLPRWNRSSIPARRRCLLRIRPNPSAARLRSLSPKTCRSSPGRHWPAGRATRAGPRSSKNQAPRIPSTAHMRRR